METYKNGAFARYCKKLIDRSESRQLAFEGEDRAQVGRKIFLVIKEKIMKKALPFGLVLFLLMAMALMSSCSSSRMIGCPSRITSIHPAPTPQS